MGRLFGTDGVRGVANRELTAELALALGAAAARRLTRAGSGRRRVAVIGRDPRASGEMLEAAVIAGLTSSIATLKAVQSLGWLDAGLDVGSFALFALLAYLTFRALRLRHTVDLRALRPGGLGAGRPLQ